MLFNVPILPAENDLTHLGCKQNKTVKNKNNIRNELSDLSTLVC